MKLKFVLLILTAADMLVAWWWDARVCLGIIGMETHSFFQLADHLFIPLVCIYAANKAPWIVLDFLLLSAIGEVLHSISRLLSGIAFAASHVIMCTVFWPKTVSIDWYCAAGIVPVVSFFAYFASGGGHWIDVVFPLAGCVILSLSGRKFMIPHAGYLLYVISASLYSFSVKRELTVLITPTFHIAVVTLVYSATKHVQGLDRE